MSAGGRLRAFVRRLDRAVVLWMRRYAHLLHRLSLGAVFIWFGMMKLLGYKSATSIIADVIYLGSPERTVPMLGAWEVLIGICLIVRRLNRAALLLLLLRLIGTLLALVFRADVCFANGPLVPTIAGQYLIKDALLFFAALVIGATVRARSRLAIRH